MTDIQATLVGAIIGGIIGVVGTYVGAIYISKKQNRTLASSKFRDAFTTTLAQLDLTQKHKGIHDPPRIDEHLVAALHIQAEAIESYRFFVPKNKQPEYQKAWDDYYKTAQGGTFREEFIGKNDPLISYSEGYEYKVISQKIHDILQFAKEK